MITWPMIFSILLAYSLGYFWGNVPLRRSPKDALVEFLAVLAILFLMLAGGLR